MTAFSTIENETDISILVVESQLKKIAKLNWNTVCYNLIYDTGNKSSCNISSGVPQGSILGLLQITIYIQYVHVQYSTY